MAADTVSALFQKKKLTILESLSAPVDKYTDLSPKGSVDEGIKDLIDEINGIDGIVTTSSCAGRISVFLEGHKTKEKDGTHDVGNDARVIFPSGKGMGGRWLFVSHDPVDPPGEQDGRSVHALFGLDDSRLEQSPFSVEHVRLIRFQFEPMILHIMAASLRHAQPILSAALNAGFRESGLQSLKALDDPDAFPMVAVRSAGLGLSSVVGYVDAETPMPGEGLARSSVSEGHLSMMLRLGNSRFKANSERIERFRKELVKSMPASNGLGYLKSRQAVNWEEKHARAERKRREGLTKQAAKRMERERNASDQERSSKDAGLISCDANPPHV